MQTRPTNIKQLYGPEKLSGLSRTPRKSRYPRQETEERRQKTANTGYQAKDTDAHTASDSKVNKNNARLPRVKITGSKPERIQLLMTVTALKLQKPLGSFLLLFFLAKIKSNCYF